MRRQGAGQGVKAIAAHDVCVPVYAASLCACLLTAVTRTGWRSCGGIGVQQPAVCTYPYTTPCTCVQASHSVEGRKAVASKSSLHFVTVWWWWCCRYTGEVHVTLIATGFPDNFEENLLTMTMGKGARQAASKQQQEALQ